MLKTGDKVVMHTCAEARNPKYAGIVWTCRSDEFKQSAGHMAVMLEGFSGSFSTEYLQKINFPDPVVEEAKEINTSLDMGELVNAAMLQIASKGLVQAAVQSRIEKTVKETVDDLFKEYSDFGKQLKEHLKANLNINFDKLEVTGYNVMVLNAIKEKLDESLHRQGVEKIKAMVDELLGTAVKEVKLSELMEEMKDDVDEDERGNEISLHVKRGSVLWFISFDPGEDVSEYRCKYRVSINDKTGEINTINIEGKELTNKDIMNGLYGVDRTLFQLFAAGGRLIVDEKDVDRYYPDRDDY